MSLSGSDGIAAKSWPHIGHRAGSPSGVRDDTVFIALLSADAGRRSKPGRVNPFGNRRRAATVGCLNRIERQARIARRVLNEPAAVWRAVMVEELPTPRSLAVAIVPLGIAVAIGNGTFLALFQFLDRVPYIVKVSAGAFLLAEGSLVAIWVAFGNRPLPVRILSAIPGMVVISLLPYFTKPHDVYTLAIGMAGVVVASLPPLMFRIIGWQLTRLTVGPDSANPQAEVIPAQFTLRQMFGWTMAVAIVAGLVRILLPKELSPQTIVTTMEIGAIYLFVGAIALATVWAAFNPRHPLVRLLAVIAVVALPRWIWPFWPFGGMRDSIYALNVCFTGCALLLFRRIGIRLVRLKPMHRLQPIDPARTP